ncbi:hypothetical protein PYCC9005_005756 [Savitreella phatthalungensis]
MDADELQRIRAARLAELQAQHGGGGPGGGSGGRGAAAGGANGAGGADQREQEATARHAMLSQVLDASARDRLRRIAIVKPDRARAIEDMVLGMARRGQIRQRVTEQELVGLLSDIAGKEEEEAASSGKGKITFQRRRDSFDEDWD